MRSDKIIEPPLHDEDERTRLIERPDGYYWQDTSSGESHGPYATMADAIEDAEYQEDGDFEESAVLHEAEEEIGISGWIDPDTGEMAEATTLHFSE